ncbi:MAG: PKD domain-containing protein, partial [Candidatus Saccharibacteria bacterium]
AMKWTLLVGFVAVLILGVPHPAAASSPSVMAPSGPSNGGYFTGTYHFDIYISCQSGLSYGTSYSNSLEGTHTFSFDGGDDGSLMVRIDGGGDLIIYSCGDPTPSYLVSSFSVSRDTTNPSVSINSPADGSTTSNSSIAVAVAAGDATSGVGQVSVNGVSASFGGGTWNASVGLNTGGNTLTALVVDRAGNSSSAAINVNRSGSSGGGTPQPTPPPSSGGTHATPTPYIGTTQNQDRNSETPVPTPEQTPGQVTQSPLAVPVVGNTTPSPSASVKAHATTKSSAAPMSATTAKMVRSLMWSLPALVLFILLFAIRTTRRRILYRWNSVRLRLSPYAFRLRVFLRGKEHDIQKIGAWAHRKHTGKVVAHHHTNYPALVFLILCSTVISGAYAFSGNAATSDSTLSLTVLGPPPTTGATINSPITGTTVDSAIIQVSGTCPVGLTVELYRNGGFAGSTYCDPSGGFLISITLTEGSNTLVARDADGLGQYGPDSNSVIVTYNAPPPPTPTPTPTTTPVPSPKPSSTPGPRRSPTPRTSASPTPIIPPFTIDTDQHYYQGINPGDAITWQLKIIGGAPAFNIIWSWGDGSSDKVATSDRGSSSPSHSYQNPGYYKVTVTATDATGRKSLIQLLVIVNGAGGIAPTTAPHDFGFLLPIWPLLAGMLLLTVSFWLGEVYFKGKEDRFAPAPAPALAI